MALPLSWPCHEGHVGHCWRPRAVWLGLEHHGAEWQAHKKIQKYIASLSSSPSSASSPSSSYLAPIEEVIRGMDLFWSAAKDISFYCWWWYCWSLDHMCTNCILHIAYCTLHIVRCTLHAAHITHITHCTHCRSLDHGCTHPAPHCQAGAVLHTLITCYPSNLHQSTQLNHRKCKWMANEGSENITPNGTGQYWWWAIIAEIFVNQVSGGCRRNCLDLSDKIPLRFPSFFLLENFKCWSYLWCKAYSFWTK